MKGFWEYRVRHGSDSEEEKDLPKFGVLVDKEVELPIHSMELLAAFENPNDLAPIEVNLKAQPLSERVSFQLRRKSPCLPTPKHPAFKSDSEEEDLPKFGTPADKEEGLHVHLMEDGGGAELKSRADIDPLAWTFI